MYQEIFFYYRRTGGQEWVIGKKGLRGGDEWELYSLHHKVLESDSINHKLSKNYTHSKLKG